MAVLLAAVLSGGTAQAQENPYVLKIDRNQYRLQVPANREAVASAASGSSALPTAAVPAQPAGPASQDHALVRMREQEYEQRIARLVQERDAWRLRAESLEAALASGRGTVTPFIYPAPPRP